MFSMGRFFLGDVPCGCVDLLLLTMTVRSSCCCSKKLDFNNPHLPKMKTLQISLLSASTQVQELGPYPQPFSLTSGGTYP